MYKRIYSFGDLGERLRTEAPRNGRKRNDILRADESGRDSDVTANSQLLVLALRQGM